MKHYNALTLRWTSQPVPSYLKSQIRLSGYKIRSEMLKIVFFSVGLLSFAIILAYIRFTFKAIEKYS